MIQSHQRQLVYAPNPAPAALATVQFTHAPQISKVKINKDTRQRLVKANERIILDGKHVQMLPPKGNQRYEWTREMIGRVVSDDDVVGVEGSGRGLEPIRFDIYYLLPRVHLILGFVCEWSLC